VKKWKDSESGKRDTICANPSLRCCSSSDEHGELHEADKTSMCQDRRFRATGRAAREENQGWIVLIKVRKPLGSYRGT